MAERIMARPTKPASPQAAAATAPAAPDLLENKLEQLKSLLWACHGDGARWSEDEGLQNLDNVFWLAWEMARDATVLLQECAGALGEQWVAPDR